MAGAEVLVAGEAAGWATCCGEVATQPTLGCSEWQSTPQD
jgi:hypothetical protein